MRDGKKLLRFDDVYGRPGINFSGSHVSIVGWSADGESYFQNRAGVMQRVNPQTDAGEPVVDAAKVAETLKGHPDFDEKAAEALKFLRGLDAVRQTALFEHNGRFYHYQLANHQLRRITRIAGTRQYPQLSPRGGYLAFVRDNNLFATPADGEDHQLTRDGSKTMLNGALDWVYQEEVYGRGTWGAYWWRDDDAFIAYLQLDESKVPVFTIVDHVPIHSLTEEWNYPKVADPNPTVRLGVVAPTGGDTRWVDLSAYKDTEFLIVRVGWTPDGKVIYQVQDRLQTWLDLNEADPKTGASRTLFRESSPAWVDVIEEPHWLPDGSFIWESARDGWRHLYHYARDGRLLGRITSGASQVRDFHVFDPKTGYVYFSANGEFPGETHAYRVSLDGGAAMRLTEPGYSHSVNIDPTARLFVDTYSNLTTPPRVCLRRSDGALERILSANDSKLHEEYEWSTPQLMRVPMRDGFEINGILVAPVHREPGKKHPIYITTYAGPAAAVVGNSWGRADGAAGQFLAQNGIAVWAVDPRSASGESTVSAWQCYQRLGITELRDIEDSIEFLKQFDYLDTERVGISGFSYGGFMASFALTNSDKFRVGIAGGSVTDWQNYDSIYTERYMLRPAENPTGYSATSVVKSAAKLHGNLLLVHGLIDENVHVQNTLQLAEQLQVANKPFDIMLYPRNRHGIGYNWRHWAELRWRYLKERL